ncbi:hypothetical protein MTO96_001666 [Rhipicephalus appendiculatus]
MESSPPDSRPELATGYEVLDHLQRVITKTPGAESSILNILGDDPFESGGRDCAHNCGYSDSSSDSARTGESSAGEAFLDDMQNVWYSKLIECLRDTAKQFGLPLSRKREMLKTPSYEAPLPEDLDSTEYELFAQLIYDTSDQLAAREFLKRGCPHCMRRLFWARVLDVPSPEMVNAEFEDLKERVIRYELLVDQIIIKDVRDTVMNDVEYFAFDDSCYQVMLAFTRDYCIARRIRSQSFGTVIMRSDLPCGAVPYYGFSLLVSPLCFMYADVGIMYAVFREMYCRYFHKLMAISSDPQGIVSLLLTFERLVQYREPEFLPALASKNVNLQPIVFQMLMQSFCAHLPVEEVLRLWDRVLGYDSVYVLPVAAASLVCSKKTEILDTKDQSSLEDMFNKLQPCDVISTLEDFLKPPDL